MKKYNNYKKYYESHKEQEIQRYLAYYYANREKILAQRKEKRKNMPKVKKLTLKERLALAEQALDLAVEELDDAKDMLRDAGKNEWAGLLNTSADYFKARAKEMLKSE